VPRRRRHPASTVNSNERYFFSSLLETRLALPVAVAADLSVVDVDVGYGNRDHRLAAILLHH
jgi:hypothetical protein